MNSSVKTQQIISIKMQVGRTKLNKYKKINNNNY